MGDKKYNEKIDIWAVGCVFAELIESTPLFPGMNDLDQLGKIIKTLGSPTLETFPRLKELPDYDKLAWNTIKTKENLVQRASPLALDLLNKMIVYDSNKRITAQEALQHSYFWESPLPSTLNQLPFIPRN